MPATRILWGQVLVVLAIVLATTWGATEWVAWRLAFQPDLGAPWVRFLGFPVYPPPAFFWWWYGFDAYAPKIFYEGAYIAASGGFVCPNLEESGQCSTQQCPVHCVVSEWSSWGACSTTCGPGTADRIRTVVENDQHGGDGCPTLLDVQSCTDEDCASDCEVSEWGIWGECDAVCSTGAQTRERTVVTPPMDSGSTCPHVVEDRACNTQACPVHCQVGAWSDWSGCNAECGGGSDGCWGGGCPCR